MKTFMLALCLSFNLFAHDEGHGPKVKNAGLYGGILASVMKEGELKKHSHHAKAYYKAELVRAQNGELSLYFMNMEMKPMPLADFASEIMVKMEVKKGGKYQYVGEFKMTKDGERFKGKLPEVRTRPFNLDFFPELKKEKLFIGFSNLD